MTYGQMLEFMQYIALLIFPLRNLGMTVAFGQRAAAALLRVNEVLSTAAAVADPPAPRSLPDRAAERRGPLPRRPLRLLAGVSRCSTASTSRSRPAASVALVGATGSGKSTVARLLTRFYDVRRRAAIAIDGVDIRDLRLGELRHAVSIVFEDTFLFNDTRHAATSPSPGPTRRTRTSSGRRGSPAHTTSSSRCPTATTTVIGERGFSLSGGQRQRIAIARAILADPRVLVLDDATSAVDPSKEHEIREAMATVMRDRTTIVIAHRPGTIALADRWCCSTTAGSRPTGTHEELLRPTSATARCSPRWSDRRSRRSPTRPSAAAPTRRVARAGRRRVAMWAAGAVSDEDRLDRAETSRVLRRSLEFAQPVQGPHHRRVRLRRRSRRCAPSPAR